MRVDYSEDEYHPGQFALWHANCRRSMQGKKGQKALQEIEQALLLMPDKRIYKDVLVRHTGEVCVIGAMLVQQRINTGMSRDEAVASCCELNSENTENVGVEIGIPRMLSWSLVVENDDEYKTRTPEQLYEHLLAWVQERISS